MVENVITADLTLNRWCKKKHKPHNIINYDAYRTLMIIQKIIIEVDRIFNIYSSLRNPSAFILFTKCVAILFSSLYCINLCYEYYIIIKTGNNLIILKCLHFFGEIKVKYVLLN